MKVPQPVFVTPSQVMYPPSQGKYPSPTQLRSWGPLLGRISNEGDTPDPGIGSLIFLGTPTKHVNRYSPAPLGPQETPIGYNNAIL